MQKILLLLLFAIATSCTAQVAVNNITDAPEITAADHHLADVYKPLDGTWEGTFLVKEDPRPVDRPANMQDVDVMLRFIDKSKTVNTIEVTQVYSSESPYFQRVKITDHYPNNGKTEQSKGVNKVQSSAT